MNNVVYQNLSKDKINKYKDNCVTILSLSPKIRYVGIINNFGQTLAGQLRKGVVPLLKPDESRNEHFIEATRNRLRKEFESSIGKTVYTFTENEKVKVIVLSNETNFCYITFDKDTEFADIMGIIQSTKKIMSGRNMVTIYILPIFFTNNTLYNITINANKEGTHAFIPMMTFWKLLILKAANR